MLAWGHPPLAGQQAPVRLTQTIRNQQTVRLAGNVHPLARAAADRGAAPAGMRLQRMLLLLKRTPQQEVALRQLIADQQQPGSAEYHQWLTPQAFGERFGSNPADIATVQQWLASQGFTVTQVAAGRSVIEFSGTAGAVAAGFHTELHRYAARGQLHWANATDPAIPQALAPVVAGVVSLNNFPKSAGHQRGQGSGQISQPARALPSFTFQGGSGQTDHALVPGDFAVIYNAAPLYQAGINGQGQTIAVVGRSDVDMNDIQQFRNLFVPSNPNNLPQVVLNGPDPGDLGGSDEGEADLDLEWSGAVAPNATVDFVVSASTDTTDGVDLSSEYIVNHNLAQVMTISFTACEAELGTAENNFIASLYEQAAAQGITVIDASGDSGAAGCDPNDGSEAAVQGGLAVSGLASTPFNTGVGGTQFQEGSGTFWSTSNDPATHASALSSIPETAWNESCVNSFCDPAAPFSATGGGASLLYNKPSWQQGTGVPGDGARDVPDLSFSASGHDGYLVCQGEVCKPDSNGVFNYVIFSGTSAAAPSFAGVMALVDQKMQAGQGLANFTLYGLAQHQQNWSQCNSATGTPASLANCIFLDTTSGDNAEPCAGGSSGCSSSAGGVGKLAGFSAHTGYDLVTGLGSINIANLVNHWASGTGALATSTTLSLSPSPTNATHGAAIALTATVTQASGVAVGPTGDIALIALTGGNGEGVDFGTLTLGQGCPSNSNCVMGTENGLPGGSYSVVARYGGDASFAPSVSNPVAVTIQPEGSVTSLAAFEADANGNEFAITQATYGDAVFLDTTVEGASAAANNVSCQAGLAACINAGVPTGNVSFTNHSSAFTVPTQPATLALNTEGAANFPNGVTTLVPGSYSLIAAYSGDVSFNSSTSPALTLTVAKASASTSLSAAASAGSTQLTATVSTTSLGLPPSGTVNFYAATTLLGSAPLTGSTDANTGFASASATLTVASSAAAAPLGAQYTGDGHYLASAPFNLAAATASATVNAGASASFALTLTPVNGFSGTVALQCSGAPAAASCTVAPTSLALNGTAASATLMVATTARSGEVAPPSAPTPPWLWLCITIGLGLLSAAAWALRQRQRWALAALFAASVLAVACGGGGSSGGGGGGGGIVPSGTPAGSYLLVVTATSGTSVSSQTLTLTVK
ncbi:MAG: protease pro-enzyme activation domain-containing protein [Terriglobales bacterium]